MEDGEARNPQAAEQGVHEAQYFYAATFEPQVCREKCQSAMSMSSIWVCLNMVYPHDD